MNYDYNRIDKAAGRERNRRNIKKPREISFSIPGLGVLGDPEITISGTGDGICGPEITLEINGERLYEYTEEDAIKLQGESEGQGMNDIKQIQLLKNAIEAYENGEILEAKDMAIEFINNVTDFETESEDEE